jgi:hypothetical protein
LFLSVILAVNACSSPDSLEVVVWPSARIGACLLSRRSPRGPRPIRPREQANARNYPSACLSKIIDCFNDMYRVPDDAFPCLSLLAEVLASVSLPGSLDLVSRLLENFNNVVYSTTSTDVDIIYIEQSIMSAVEHSAEKVTVRGFVASDKRTIEKFPRRLQILLPVRSAWISSCILFVVGWTPSNSSAVQCYDPTVVADNPQTFN